MIARYVLGAVQQKKCWFPTRPVVYAFRSPGALSHENPSVSYSPSNNSSTTSRYQVWYAVGATEEGVIAKREGKQYKRFKRDACNLSPRANNVNFSFLQGLLHLGPRFPNFVGMARIEPFNSFNV